jgi:threonine dehydratase
MIGLADIEAARARIRPVIRLTPVDPSDSFSQLSGRPVLLKPEQRQRTGSFKIRGAYNFVSRLPPGTEVVAASAGNHAQGVALAARLTGLRATIFMPVGAALPKVEATRGYGAAVRLEGEAVDDSMVLAQLYAGASGAVYVPPFDHPFVIAGQGTIGLELAEEVPDAEVVVVPVGGGGLLAGVATALAHTRRRVRVIGVESAGAPTMRAALDAGSPVVLPHLATMADGIAVRATSELALAHVRAYVDDIVTVDEEEISGAMLLLVERAKAVVEPAGAVGLAAILAGKIRGQGPAVAVISGGNVDPLLLINLIGHGLSAAGRYLVLRIVMTDRPGALAGLTTILAGMNLNVLDVEHHRSGLSLGLLEVELTITVESRNLEHRQAIVDELRRCGYQVDFKH